MHTGCPIGQHHLANLAAFWPVILTVARFKSLFDIVFGNGDFSGQRFRREHRDAAFRCDGGGG